MAAGRDRCDLHADTNRLSESNQVLQRIHGEMAAIVGSGDSRGTTLRLVHEYLRLLGDRVPRPACPPRFRIHDLRHLRAPHPLTDSWSAAIVP
jgi:hypothetical protein